MLEAIETSMIVGPTQFNVSDEHGNWLCPCCGMTDQFETMTYDGRGGIIGSGICGACFWEPGFDDDPMASAKADPIIIASLLAYRAEWVSISSPWRSTSTFRPDRWDAAETMKRLFALAPHLAGGNADAD
jgi:hypothetical protein